MPSIRFTFILTCFLSCMTSLSHVSNAEDSILSRHPRYLVYPPRGAFKLVLGMGIPFPGVTKGSYVAWTYNFQFQYALPIDVAQLNLPPKARGGRSGRSLRHIDRTTVYATLEDYMEVHGMQGRECLLRSICDAAAFPLHHDGLLGNLLQILLTPRMRDSSCSEYIHREYHEAQILGENGVDCSAAFPSCSLSLLDLVSQLHDPHH